MNRWKKMAAIAAVLSVTAGAGAAWAQDDGSGENLPPAGAPADPGDSTRLLGAGRSANKFVPITPCRLVDTRQAVGRFAPKETRRYDVKGSEATFAAQGGKPGGCGIPSAGVTAVEITVTALEADGKGFLRVFPTTEPQATFLNYTNVFNPSNAGTVGLCGSDGGICLANRDLGVKAFTEGTDVVIDVQGYFERVMAGSVNAAGSLSRGSRIVSADNTNPGAYEVIFDRPVDTCVYTGVVGDPSSGSPDGYLEMTPLGTDDNGVFVRTRDANGAGADRPFYIEVIC